VTALHEGGRVAPSVTTVRGRTAIRAAIVNHRTAPADVDALVEAVLALGRAARSHERRKHDAHAAVAASV
jgi:aromatic-L-amino-acid/L-tryptophan decarboxylase